MYNDPTTPKKYECICHVCGLIHTVEAVLIDGTMAYCSDGKPRLIRGCGHHERGEVRAAYDRIFKADQYGRYAPLPEAHA